MTSYEQKAFYSAIKYINGHIPDNNSRSVGPSRVEV